MKLSTMAMAIGALVLGTGLAHAQDKTFSVWWFEDPASAQGTAWTAALEEFKAAHPDVTVTFEQKTFAQLQASGSMILNSDQAPDVLEYNKGNATAGLVASQGLLTNLDDYVTSQGWDKILNEGTEGTVAATAWLKANPEQIDKWLDGVTTFKGEPGAAAVKAKLGL